MVMDSVNEAVRTITKLLHANLANPPVPIRSLRKQKNRAESHIENFYTTIDIPDNIEVYEIWKAILHDTEMNEVFFVISGICTMAGYREVQWSNIKYRGFYHKVDEAINAIYEHKL